MKRFFGGLLMTLGVLIGSLSGLCTATFLVTVVMPKDYGALPLVLLLGLPAIALGIGLFFAGRYLWRSAAPPSAKTLDVFDEPPSP